MSDDPLRDEANRAAHRVAKLAVDLKVSRLDYFAPMSERIYLDRRLNEARDAYEEIERRQAELGNLEATR